MPGREKVKNRAPRSNPLGDDIHASRFARNKKDAIEKGKTDNKANDASDGHFLIPTRTTQRILRTAREELERIQEEEINESGATTHSNFAHRSKTLANDNNNNNNGNNKNNNINEQSYINSESNTTESIVDACISNVSNTANDNEDDVGLESLLAINAAPTTTFEEYNNEEEEELEEEECRKKFSTFDHMKGNNNNNNDINNIEMNNGDDDNEDVAELEYDETESVASEELETTDDLNEPSELFDIDDEETRLLQKFQPASKAQSRTLADMIMEKIKEKELDVRVDQAGSGNGANNNNNNNNDNDNSQNAQTCHASGATVNLSGMTLQTKHKLREQVNLESEMSNTTIDSRVARVYSAIGSVMKKYTSGKVPKAFKILPNVENWEQLIMLTKPDQWSPHATYQATRIFAANLNERMAQRFYAALLLPIVHERLREEHKLHPALYNAVRKALFKPIAFFKGFLLPLVSDEECTLREALVIASILQRCHLPPIPTAVTMVKITQLPFSAVCCVFLRVLIDKKMTLPYQAIDALVIYFHRFTRTHTKEEKLPVLWHQTLLSFAQRYKLDLTPRQLQLLSEVCTMHFHYLITPEIRREIQTAVKNQATNAASNTNSSNASSSGGRSAHLPAAVKAREFASSRIS